MRLPRLLAAPALAGALGVLALALGAGTALSACDATEGCEGGQLQITELSAGTGPAATASDSVRVAYTASVSGGALFLDSNDFNPDGETVYLPLALEGFRQGVTGMREDGRRRVTVPPDLAYGESGVAGQVPPCATIIYNITLLEVL